MLHATALKVNLMTEETPKPTLRLVEMTKSIEERVDGMELASAYFINALRLRRLAKRAPDEETRKRYMEVAVKDLELAIDLFNHEE